MDKLQAVLLAMYEIQLALEDQRSGSMGAAIGELDWREELYYCFVKW